LNAKKLALLMAIFLLTLNCSTSKQQARQTLDKMGVEYSEKEFFNSVIKGKTEIVSLFLEAGMSSNTKKGEITALMEAARRGKTHTEIAAALIKGGAEINARDPFGVTPLMFAAISGASEIIRMLLKSGADVKAKDADGRTVLIEALTTENGSPPEIVEELIQAGAEVNVRIYGGLTPLMISAGGDSRILRAIIKAGADLNAADDRGATALRWARESPANYQILKDAGAKE
jgi:ankyrin repeat protein